MDFSLVKRWRSWTGWGSAARGGAAIQLLATRSMDRVARELGLTIQQWEDRLKLYPWSARWVFERKLHFVARMDVAVAKTPAGKARTGYFRTPEVGGRSGQSGASRSVSIRSRE